MSDIRSWRANGPVIFNSPEVHELAETGEFELRSGTSLTVGGRVPDKVGLAYSPKVGLVVAPSQEEADIIAKKLVPKPELALV